MHKFFRRLTISTGLLIAGWASANLFPKSGKIYDPKAGSGSTPLFSFDVTIENKGDIKKTYYKDPDGKVVLSEITTLKDGVFQRFELDDGQRQSKGLIERRDGTIHFSYTNDKGVTKTAVEPDVDNFIVSSTSLAYVQRHWATLMKGEKVKVRFGVPDRADSVSFEYQKTKEYTEAGRARVTIRMKASNFIIAALVDPIYFEFDKEEVKVLESNGRVIPKRFDGKAYKDLDALVVYGY